MDPAEESIPYADWATCPENCIGPHAGCRAICRYLRLLLLNESAMHQVGVSVRFDLVILQARDGAIHFEHSQRNLIAAVNAVLPQSAVQFVHADPLPRHMRL